MSFSTSIYNKLISNTTITLTTAMTAAEKQSIIDAIPHDTNGYTLTFQFEDGTHTHTDSLIFGGFYGPGTVIIQGNSEESIVLHTDQAVYIDATGLDSSEHTIYTTRCLCYVVIRYLKVQMPDAEQSRGIAVVGNSNTYVAGNYVYGTGKTTNTYAIRFDSSLGNVHANYVSNVKYGITCVGGVLQSIGNDDTGTTPDYAINAAGGGSIGTNGTQPAATKSVWVKYTGGQIDDDKLQYNFTITFLTSNTVAEKQEMIDQAPHNMNGFQLTFQFQDGTHTHSDTLVFDGFYGPGNIMIQGNTGETNSLHTNQSVYINGTGLASSEFALSILRCHTLVYVRYIKIQIPDLLTAIGIYASGCPKVEIYGNYCYGAGKTAVNIGIYCETSFSYVQNNYVSNVYHGITCDRARMYSNTNDDAGTAPTYGLRSLNAGTIGKTGTQPAGTTANETAYTGGVIR